MRDRERERVNEIALNGLHTVHIQSVWILFLLYHPSIFHISHFSPPHPPPLTVYSLHPPTPSHHPLPFFICPPSLKGKILKTFATHTSFVLSVVCNIWDANKIWKSIFIYCIVYIYCMIGQPSVHPMQLRHPLAPPLRLLHFTHTSSYLRPHAVTSSPHPSYLHSLLLTPLPSKLFTPNAANPPPSELFTPNGDIPPPSELFTPNAANPHPPSYLHPMLLPQPSELFTPNAATPTLGAIYTQCC